MVSPADRFWSKVQRSSGCWLWTGAIGKGGYGNFWDGERYLNAHRWAFEDANGPVPEGLVIDHLCRTRACVNPIHMEVVSCGENIRRGVGFAAKNAVATHCPAGHPYDEANTYVRPDGKGRGCMTCRKLRNDISNAKRKAMR